MSTEYDQEQDRRIARNAEDISKLTEYIREIRNHLLPEVQEARMRRFARLVVVPIVKVLALLAFIGGVWDALAWFYARWEIKCMADRYAEVAKSVYYGENNPEVATGFLDKAIELRDGDADYRFQRAYMEGMAAVRKLVNLDRPFSKAELDQAHRAYAEALFLQGLRPESADPLVLQGQILAALKESERAEEVLRRALELEPGNAFVLIRLAQVKMDRKDYDGAEKELARAAELDPKSKWVWLWKGVCAHEGRKDEPAARDCYEKALALDPKFDLALYNLGWTWMQGKGRDYAKVRDCMQRALRINPGYKEACYAIGMSYGYEDNYPIAKVWLDKAVALDGEFLTALKWRGIVCSEMKDFAGAVADYDAAVRLDPMNADLYVRRAKANERLGRTDEALRDLRFAYEIKPNQKRTLLYLGDLYAGLKDLESAVRNYRRALQASPDYDDAHARLAQAYFGLGRRAEALAELDAAIACTKYKVERFWLQKGELLAKDEPTQALECYVKARTANVRCAAAWKAEFALCDSLGRTDAATAALKRYVELAPTDAEARKALDARAK